MTYLSFEVSGGSTEVVRMGQVNYRELIDCHDCGEQVSFSAAACPHCGSTEPSGPYIQNVRERRKLRAEATNDRRLVTITLICCGIGVLYGAVMEPGGAASVWGGLTYGFVGAVIGVPAAFIVNVTRALFD